MSDITKLADEYLKKGFKPSSSELNQLCVQVHVNPLLEECVVNGRIVSDLEYALQSNNIDMLRTLSNNIRNVRYGEQISRHLSTSDIESMIERIDDKLAELGDSNSSDVEVDKASLSGTESADIPQVSETN